jgi:PleD family two-component response regulator
LGLEASSVARSALEEKRRILIVDDDRDSSHLIKILLEKAGHYLVLEEYDALKAHQSAQNFGLELILLDTMMPQRDGGDTLKPVTFHYKKSLTPRASRSLAWLPRKWKR